MTRALRIAADVAFWPFMIVGAAALTDIPSQIIGSGTVIVPLPSVWWSAAVGIGCLTTACVLGWLSPWKMR